MNVVESEDDYQETAIGYALGVLTYMQNGGKLSDIEATASEFLRLAGLEAEQKVPGSLKARVLMDSVDEMRVRHNSLIADGVFRDMMAQARNAGRIRTEKRKNVQSFKDIAADVVTAHEGGTYQEGANAAADHVAGAIGKYGKWVVLAAAAAIEHNPNDFEDIPADQVMEFLEENYLNHSGATVGHALETYARGMAENGTGTELAKLYDRLDRAGGVDLFDWRAYAEADRTPTMGMHFVIMPVPAGEAGVFLFGS